MKNYDKIKIFTEKLMIVFYIILLVTIYILKFPENFQIIIYVFIAFMFFLNPMKSIGFYLLYEVISPGYFSTDYSIVVIGICGSIQLSFDFFKKKKIKFNSINLEFILLGIFIFITLLYNKFYNFSLYRILYIDLVSCYIMYSIFKSDLNINLEILTKYIIFSGYFATFLSLSSLVENISRLRLFGSVRFLANILAFAIIISILNFYKSNGKKKINIVNIIVFIFVLIMTGSRGTLYLVVGFLIIFLLLLFKKNPINILILCVGIPLVITKIINIIPDTFDIERLLDINDSGRSEIWKMIIEGNSLSQWIFGAGLNYPIETYNWYSHSVFLDCIVCLGVFSFIVLIFIICKRLIRALREKNIYGFILLVFTIGLYIPHGYIYITSFWVKLGLCLGMIDFWKLNQDQKMFNTRMRS